LQLAANPPRSWRGFIEELVNHRFAHDPSRYALVGPADVQGLKGIVQAEGVDVAIEKPHVEDLYQVSALLVGVENNGSDLASAHPLSEGRFHRSPQRRLNGPVQRILSEGVFPALIAAGSPTTEVFVRAGEKSG